MNESLIVENIELISDEYELLHFESKEVINKEDTKSISNVDIEIDVLSKFKDLSYKTKDLSLGKMIQIYKIQNEQIQTIMSSIK